MGAFLGIVRTEYRMSIRRWWVWAAFVGGQLLLAPGVPGLVSAWPRLSLWQWSGVVAVIGNMLPPIVAGIVIADRLVRDRTLGVRELFCATPVPRHMYILGKYTGATLAVLTQALAAVLTEGALFVASGLPPALLVHALGAFLAVDVPALLFVGAFSVACPEVLPLRVYQVLFTGYWFWATAIPSSFMPTVNGTLLSPKGDYAASAFFAEPGIYAVRPYTPIEGALNILVLLACAGVALIALERYMAWQAKRA